MVKRHIEEVDEYLRSYQHTKDKVPRSCYFTGCKKKSHGFNVKGGLGYGPRGGSRISCKVHKLSEHVEQNQLCIYEGCVKKGTLFIGDNRFCAEHIDIVKDDGGFPEDYVTRSKNTNICKHVSCNLVASFDNSTHCREHSVSEKSDDKRRCNYPGCTSTSRPTFGFHGEKKTRCNDHKDSSMFSRKICNQYPNCKRSASYGESCGVPLTCVQHKLEHYVLKTMVDSFCEMPCCIGMKIQPKVKFEGKNMCVFSCNVLVGNAYLKGDMDLFTDLIKTFDMKNIDFLNSENAFKFECEKFYYKLVQDCSKICFNSQVGDGPKLRENKRPDVFYKWVIGNKNFGIHFV